MCVRSSELGLSKPPACEALWSVPAVCESEAAGTSLRVSPPHSTDPSLACSTFAYKRYLFLPPLKPPLELPGSLGP